MWPFTRAKSETAQLRRRRTNRPTVEGLDTRDVPAVMSPTRALIVPMAPVANAAISEAASNVPLPAGMEKTGMVLSRIYQEFVAFRAANPTGTFQSSYAGSIQFFGDQVGVTIRGTGSSATLAASVQASAGVTVLASDPSFPIVSGFVPINRLPDLANTPGVVGVDPMSVPSHGLVMGGSVSTQGTAALNRTEQPESRQTSPVNRTMPRQAASRALAVQGRRITPNLRNLARPTMPTNTDTNTMLVPFYSPITGTTTLVPLNTPAWLGSGYRRAR